MKGLVALARALSNPARILRRLLLLFPGLPTSLKLELDLYDSPQYAYGLHKAAQQARALGLPSIASIEFGVGSGRGLLSMEKLADEISAATGVEIRVFGFDTGAGLPEPRDYRDLPYLYRGGFYAMDVDGLRRALNRAELILGDVSETAPAFLTRDDVPPIGFVVFDLDYYTSTRDALQILDGDRDRYLPRVLCNLDDISNAEALQSDYTGEMLAVGEFNEADDERKIAPIAGLAASRAIPSLWNEQMFACHFFDHPLYGEHVVAGAENYVGALSDG